MSKRYRMSKKTSRKEFRKFSGTHKKNIPTTSYVMRGGIRM